MHMFKKRKMRGSEMRYAPVIIIVLIGIAFLIWRGVWGVYQKEVMSREVVEELRAEEVRLSERKKDLEKRMHDLETQEGITRTIREKFDVARDGEEVIVLVDPPATTTNVVNVEKGFWGRLWDSVKGVFK